MTRSEAEHAEMVEEARSIMETQNRHPWPMLMTALKEGDRAVAEAVWRRALLGSLAA